MTTLAVKKIAAFSAGLTGGNPAGVWIGEALPDVATMQQTAAEVGFSETVFAQACEDGWRVRYFSPESEVPFCGHATIALGAALAAEHGAGRFALTLQSGARISVEAQPQGELFAAALQSPPTHSGPLAPALLSEALSLFAYRADQLDPALPPALANGGAQHLVLALRDRAALREMSYELDAGRRFMRRLGLATIVLVHAQTARLFHTRNPFASGGVYEDPATGAASAALGGYLRDIDWPHQGAIEIVQGEDMGCRSLIQVQIPPQRGASIRVAGTTRPISA
jgi:PhzF family phenazine biosynthesis protein